jgi:hypothetical protein
VLPRPEIPLLELVSRAPDAPCSIPGPALGAGGRDPPLSYLDLTQRILPAGATTGFICSLCSPGTYQTGSGQEALLLWRISMKRACHYPSSDADDSTACLLQALLRGSTAACAGQGPTRQGQVRVHCYIVMKHVLFAYYHIILQFSLLSCYLANLLFSACRRYYRPQLQPVLARDLPDRIRSECSIKM